MVGQKDKKVLLKYRVRLIQELELDDLLEHLRSVNTLSSTMVVNIKAEKDKKQQNVSELTNKFNN